MRLRNCHYTGAKQSEGRETVSPQDAPERPTSPCNHGKGKRRPERAERVQANVDATGANVRRRLWTWSTPTSELFAAKHATENKQENKAMNENTGTNGTPAERRRAYSTAEGVAIRLTAWDTRLVEWR